MFLDKNGLPVQSNLDGGDSAQRVGFIESFQKFRERLGLKRLDIPGMADFQTACGLLITPKGLIRNPIKYDDPYMTGFATSRDQTRPMIIACGLNGMNDNVEKISPKGFILEFYPNRDLASPENWNEERRALGKDGLLIGDVFSAGGAITRCVQAKSDPDDVGDDLNTFLTLTFFYLVGPTRISTANLRYYLDKRPANFGNTKAALNDWAPEADPVLGAISWYNRPADAYRGQPASGGNQEMVEVCRPVIQRLRSDLNVPL